MKTLIIFLTILLSGQALAQVGINTPNPNSTLDVRGSQANKLSRITTSTLLTKDHHVIIGIPTTDIDITLPTAIGISGRTYVIKNTSLNKISIKVQQGQTIDGMTNYSLAIQNQSIEVTSDGSNWIVLSKYTP